MKQVAFVILRSPLLQWSEMVIINPRHKQLFSSAAREAVAVRTWSSVFAAAFRSGLKLISGAGVGSLLCFHSMFLSYLLCE